MKVFISGLSQLDFLAYFGGHVESALEWCESAHFVDILESSIHATEPQCAVWLYRAPWMIVGSRFSAEQDSQFILDAWLEQQRIVLKNRRAFGDLLLLVNVDRVSAPELLARLGVATSEEALLPPVVGESVSSAALAKVFEWVAPTYWEIFESLESAAWLSQGEPIFRSTLRAPSNSSLFQLLNVLQAGLNLPIQRALLAAAQDSVAGLQQDLDMSIKSQADRDELITENDSLLLQLHQVQEELESILLVNEENSAGVEEERRALIAEKEAMASELGQSHEFLKSTEARCVELQQALVQSGNALSEQLVELERERVRLSDKEAMLAAAQDSVARLQQDLQMSIRSQADRDELLKENESLLLQLQQVQEGLESVLLANEKNSAGVEQERVTLVAEKEAMANELGQSRELLKSTEARCVELQQALVQSDNAQADIQALVKENEILLLQLHQVQEDLEHYYSAHQSLLETVAPVGESDSTAGEVAVGPTKVVVEEKAKEPSRMLALLSAPVIQYVKRSKAEKKLQLQMIFVEQSGFFDRKWYLQMYPDVLNLKIDPVKHYLKFGWEERRDPSARFSTSYYLNTYPDIQTSGVNPLIHYIKFGAAEGREPRAPWSQNNSR